MTRAIILAAGQGTRLRPLTDNRPKCLVPFVGKRLLERQVQVLHHAGINNIHVAAGYCAEQIKALGFSYSINNNYAHSNMVATLFSAIDFISGEDDLIISYGDIIYQPENLSALLKCQDAIGIMVDVGWKDYWTLRFADPLSDAETMRIDQQGYITELGKKTTSYDEIQGQYTGLIKIRADRLQDFIDFYQKLDKQATYDGKDFANMYFTSFLQALIDHHWQIKAVQVNHGWLEIDSVNDLELYERMYQRNELAPFYRMND